MADGARGRQRREEGRAGTRAGGGEKAGKGAGGICTAKEEEEGKRRQTHAVPAHGADQVHLGESCTLG